MSHPLDRPIWSALTSERQASLAVGASGALRFAPGYGVFAASVDQSPESLAAMALLERSEAVICTIEADPVHLPHHVAFAWDNYRAERYEVVKAIGNFLPKLAPASSDAWMLFGFANGLTPNSSNTLTEAAFVLALQLSTNPEATRRHFRELTVSPYHPHIRKMLDAALADGRARPGLLKSVQRL